MPFAGHWAEYKKGDLIYGLEEENDPTRGKYRKLWKVQGASIIDAFPPLAVPGATKPTGTQTKSFHKAMKKHSTYRDVFSHRQLGSYDGLGDDDADSRLIRQKSKGGLHWACKVAQVDVHFILDNIALAGVINKNTVVKGEAKDTPQGPAGPEHAKSKKRAVTGSELRWIYRNRDDQDVQNHIQFWKDEQQVGPPWEDDPNAWQAYQPRYQRQPHADNDEGGCGCFCFN